MSSSYRAFVGRRARLTRDQRADLHSARSFPGHFAQASASLRRLILSPSLIFEQVGGPEPSPALCAVVKAYASLIEVGWTAAIRFRQRATLTLASFASCQATETSASQLSNPCSTTSRLLIARASLGLPRRRPMQPRRTERFRTPARPLSRPTLRMLSHYLRSSSRMSRCGFVLPLYNRS